MPSILREQVQHDGILEIYVTNFDIASYISFSFLQIELVKKLRFVYLLQAGERNFFIS